MRIAAEDLCNVSLVGSQIKAWEAADDRLAENRPSAAYLLRASLAYRMTVLAKGGLMADAVQFFAEVLPLAVFTLADIVIEKLGLGAKLSGPVASQSVRKTETDMAPIFSSPSGEKGSLRQSWPRDGSIWRVGRSARSPTDPTCLWCDLRRVELRMKEGRAMIVII
mmetsp:Transcript_27151/g.53338  ORF Transcript_27151/g.53338 Transcript_27151/m.53338 type:complete len:166 (+) Transcript_27151:1103-1600(+)